MAQKFRLYFGVLVLFTLVNTLIMLFNTGEISASGGFIAAIYMPLAFLGQAFVFSLLLGLVLLPFLILPKRAFLVVFALLAATTWFALAVDAWVYNVYRFHINAFFIKMLFVDRAGMGIGLGVIAAGVAALLVFIMVAYVFISLISGLFKYLRTGVIYSLLAMLMIVGQGIHAWGYAHNMSAIVSLSQYIPWYTPLTATTKLRKLGLINEQLVEDNLVLKPGKVSGFNYPSESFQCTAQSPANIIFVSMESMRFDRYQAEITPNMVAIGSESLYFNNHLSTGSVTDRGLFGLFYGISPVFFNSAMAAGKQPALIQSTTQLGYDHWVLANQDIEVNKLDTLLFNGIEPLQSVGKGAVYNGDAGLIKQFKQQLDEHNGTQPFFSFLLFNGSHFPYWTPPDYPLPFTPAERFTFSKATDDTIAEPYINQYSNSLHYLDSLIGELKAALVAKGQWDNSIVVITGDHGEEFKDQEQVYWGHGSNFTRYQTSVPLVIHWPGRQAEISYRTSHEDIAATLMIEALNCDVAFESISTGHSLFDDSQRVNIITSYVNQAIIVDETVNELLPGLLKTYSLDSVDDKVKTPAAAIKGVQQIYQQFR